MSSFGSEVDDGVATRLKEEGNQFYKSGNYGDAISAYTSSLGLTSDRELSAVLYGNRCAAYLGLKKFSLAETDARQALYLKSTVEKYSYRLATALSGQGKDEEALKVINEASAVHTGSTSLRKLKAEIVHKKQGVAIQKGVDRIKSTQSRRSASARSANGLGPDNFCLPCEIPSQSSSESTEEGAFDLGDIGKNNGDGNSEYSGALIIETVPGTAYSDTEFNMLAHLKALIKSLQSGDIDMNSHFLTGKFKRFADKTYFKNTLFPGFSTEVLEGMPQTMRELLLWKELTLDLTDIAKSAAAVFDNVKRRGEAAGEVMDAETVRVLGPQIAQEAFAQKLEKCVHIAGKHFSRVVAKVQLDLASPSAPEAALDQLDDELIADLLSPSSHLCVQEEYLGSDWADLLLTDVMRFCDNERMNDASAASTSTDLDTSTGITSLTVPTKIAWVFNEHVKYPALSEVMRKLHALPYEINKKSNTALKLLQPAKGSIAVRYHPQLSAMAPHYDNRGGEADSGISLSCTLYLVPAKHRGDATTIGHMRHGLGAGGRPRADTVELGQTEEVVHDSLIMHRSSEVCYSLSPAQTDFYSLSLYVHSQ